jgi:hypothetical protein
MKNLEQFIIEYAYEHYNLEVFPYSLEDIPQDIIDEIIVQFKPKGYSFYAKSKR